MITITGTPLTRPDLLDYPVQRPKRAGRIWQGISHHHLASTVCHRLEKRGLPIQREGWTVDTTGASLVGALMVQFPERYLYPKLEGMQYCLGIRHTNDCRFALTFAVGAEVFVCHNGLITGSFVLKRKHTSGLDLETEVETGLSRFVQEARQVAQVVESMKERRLTRKQSDHLLMEAGRRNLLAWSHIGQVQDEYVEPSYEDFRGRNAWCLYNAFTHIVKKSSPLRQFRSLDRFRRLLCAA